MHVTTIVNGVDLDRLSGTIDAVAADSALARFHSAWSSAWERGMSPLDSTIGRS